MTNKELKEKDLVPRSLQDRYSILIIEQLIRLNENIERMANVSEPQIKPRKKKEVIE